MIICDRCKKVPKGTKNQPFLYEISCFKMEETKVGKKGTATGREVIKITMHLCDSCITAFNKDLGYFVNGIRENEPVEIPNDLTEPVGVTEREFGGGHAVANDPALMANEQFVSNTK